jgi:hypothetical protein
MARSNLSHAVVPHLHPQISAPKSGTVHRSTILHGHVCCECERFRPCLDQLGKFKKIVYCWLARYGQRESAWTCQDCLSRDDRGPAHEVVAVAA